MKVRGCIALLLSAAALTFMLLLKDCSTQSDRRRQALAVATEQAAAKSAAQAAELARQNEALRIVERQRVEREIEGFWRGSDDALGAWFDPVERTRAPYLRITKNAKGYLGVLRDRFARVDYEGRLIDRNQTEIALLLTPVKVTGDIGKTKTSGLYQPILAVPKQDGTFQVWGVNAYSGAPTMTMQRIASPEGKNGLDGVFAERLSEEVEFVPTQELRLYDEIGVAVWDSLPLTEVKTRQLRIFDSGLVVNYHGFEYHHIIVRGPNYEERKAWRMVR